MSDTREVCGMPCPACGHKKSRVTDTRLQLGKCYALDVSGPARRRRRECMACHHKFTTYETLRREQPSDIEEFVTKVAHYRSEFGVESEVGRSAYEAMAATV